MVLQLESQPSWTTVHGTTAPVTANFTANWLCGCLERTRNIFGTWVEK